MKIKNRVLFTAAAIGAFGASLTFAQEGTEHGNGGGGGEPRYHDVQKKQSEWLHRYLNDGTLASKLDFTSFNADPSVQIWLKNRGEAALTPVILVKAYDDAIAKIGGRVRFIKEQELSAIAQSDELAAQLEMRKSRTCVNWVNPQTDQGYVYCVTERWNAETVRDQGVLGFHEPLGTIGLESDVIDQNPPQGMGSHYSAYPISPSIWKYAGEKVVEVKEFQMFERPIQNSVSQTSQLTWSDLSHAYENANSPISLRDFDELSAVSKDFTPRYYCFYRSNAGGGMKPVSIVKSGEKIIVDSRILSSDEIASFVNRFCEENSTAKTHKKCVTLESKKLSSVSHLPMSVNAQDGVTSMITTQQNRVDELFTSTAWTQTNKFVTDRALMTINAADGWSSFTEVTLHKDENGSVYFKLLDFDSSRSTRSPDQFGVCFSNPNSVIPM